MIVEFVDCEGGPSLSAGRKISDDNELLQLFSSLQFRTPFFFKLKGENGFSLDIGLGYGLGCVQHSRDSGDPPYMMAVNVAENRSDEYLEFVMGGTATPVSVRYCLPAPVVRDIAAYFLKTGNRSPAVPWEEI